MKEMSYQVEMIDVLHDERTIQKALNHLSGMKKVVVDYKNQRIHLAYNELCCNSYQIEEILSSLDYEFKVIRK